MKTATVTELRIGLLSSVGAIHESPAKTAASSLANRYTELAAQYRTFIASFQFGTNVMYAKKFNLHSLPGGGIDNGEDEFSALVREVYEETGCTCDSIKPLGVVYENRYHAHFTSLSYYFVVHTKTEKTVLHLTDAEIENGTILKWHSFDELYNLIKNAEHKTNQRKFLQARDLLALNEYQQNHRQISIVE